VGAGLLMLYPQGTTNTLYTSMYHRMCMCSRMCIVYDAYVGPGRRRAASDPGGHPCKWARRGGAHLTWRET
jgi:hypothetical protein